MDKAPASATEANKYHVPALEKGLDILEALAYTSRPISLTELAHRLDRSPSELFRLLAALEMRGYINKEANTGTYSLSLKLYELAHQHPPELNLLDAVTVPMEEFARQTNESCHLSVFRLGQISVLKEALASGHIRLSVASGSHLSAMRSSSGRLLLAYQSPEALSAFLASSSDYQTLGKDEKRAFLTRLDNIRATRLSSAENENHLGVRDAAVPVGNVKIGLVAALASTWLVAMSNPAHVDMIVRELMYCAEKISAAMGLSSDIANEDGSRLGYVEE